jgi:deoxyribodipyrimidine photo-lyase
MGQEKRIHMQNSIEINTAGSYVLYWIQTSVREDWNHSLEFAAYQANKLHLPLRTIFILRDDFPEANLRHYQFLIEGLVDLQPKLHSRNIGFEVQCGKPQAIIKAHEKKAACIISDFVYLKHQRSMVHSIIESSTVPWFLVESDLVVPIAEASGKEEYAAYTIRKKLHSKIPQYSAKPRKVKIEVAYDGMQSDMQKEFESLHIKKDVGVVDWIKGGESNAKAGLEVFIQERLRLYGEKRSDPSLGIQSHMSPYLHFGHISPGYISSELLKHPGENTDAYLEELIIRRELAYNFVFYNPEYDSPLALPDWAKKTLNAHEDDVREYSYDLEVFEKAETHDPYWNACMKEMVQTGKMHNYMRMYWGKKILEWSSNWKEAYRIALMLNNKYSIDGRNPNSFAGVAWCFGKHDRPWTERKIFGMVRYMNANGLKRKFDIESYARQFNEQPGLF